MFNRHRWRKQDQGVNLLCSEIDCAVFFTLDQEVNVKQENRIVCVMLTVSSETGIFWYQETEALFCIPFFFNLQHFDISVFFFKYFIDSCCTASRWLVFCFFFFAALLLLVDSRLSFNGLRYECLIAFAINNYQLLESR